MNKQRYAYRIYNGTFESRRFMIHKRSLSNAPIYIVIGYLLFTEIVFFFGPWPWPLADVTTLVLYLAAANIALVMGFAFGVFSYRSAKYVGPPVYRLLIISITLNLLLVGFTSQFRSGSFFPNIIHGLENPAEAYFESNQRRALGGDIIEYVRMLLSPMLLMAFPIFVFHFRRLKLGVKFFGFVFFIWWACIFIAIGTNKALADFALLVPILMCLNRFANLQKLAYRARLFRVVIFALLAYAFLRFFGYAISERLGGGEGEIVFPILGISADNENIFLGLLPEQLKPAFIHLYSYITQGYYGLYLALDKDFIPTWGVGNSMFLTANFEKITTIGALSNVTYPYRVSENGWDPLVNWHTIYPWIASDLSFPGSVIFIFFVGVYFAKSWCDVCVSENPVALVLFTQFLIMIFYFPANNQLFQTGEALIGFVGVFFYWFFTRLRFQGNGLTG